MRDDEVERLQRAWREAAPFPHVVIDGVIDEETLGRWMEILEEEGVDGYEGDLFAFEATPVVARSEAFEEVRRGIEAMAPWLARVTGKRVARADVRAYAYRVGHYLLPHSDHREGLGRQIAFAYYLPSPEPPVGGELELFACRVEAGEIVETTSARVIEPRANRIVLFDVSDVSLHQVREVMAGLRLSLAGWFYP